MLDLEVMTEGKHKAMGSRHTPSTLKQLKTDLQNMVTRVFKRTEYISDSKVMPFFLSVYIGKQNKYAYVPQEMVEGDRKRKLIMPPDLERIDCWVAAPHQELERPRHLALKVAFSLLEHDCSRGTGVLFQIRRRSITPHYDEEGGLYFRFKQVVVRKTMMGSCKRGYKPLDFSMTAALEVENLRRLLEVLPPVGCQYCLQALVMKPVGQDPLCICDKIFLNEVSLDKWRPNNNIWFKHQACSRESVSNMVRELCKLAGTKEDHTNGDVRVTIMTSLAMAQMSPNQVSTFSKSTPAEQERYKRLGEQMTEKQIQQARALTSSSGRNALRGLGNKFGDLSGGADSRTHQIYRRYLALLEHESTPEVSTVNQLEKTIN